MITATPPAYHQVIELEDRRRVSAGYSDDAKNSDQLFISSLNHLLSTPGKTFAASFYDDYETPPPQSKRRMKVKFNLLGAGTPLPFDEDNQD